MVSIVIPTYNEEQYIYNVLLDVTKQTYKDKIMEIIIVDGLSNDNTLLEIKRFIGENTPEIEIKIIENKKRIVPIALNKGIMVSKGNYICRLDAHTYYPENYIENCFNASQKIDCANVGGRVFHKSNNTIGEAYSKALSTKFGVGDSKFRVGNFSGFVDTVPFGFYQKNIFEQVGLFNEKLVRNQDYEMNKRIRDYGGLIYLDEKIYCYYQSPNNFIDIIKQNYNNGKWNILTSKISGNVMALRHFVPLIFTSFLIMSLIFSRFIKFFLPIYITYVFLSFYYSIKCCTSIKVAVIQMFLYPIIHVSYGIGSLVALFSRERSD